MCVCVCVCHGRHGGRESGRVVWDFSEMKNWIRSLRIDSTYIHYLCRTVLGIPKFKPKGKIFREKKEKSKMESKMKVKRESW